MDTPEGTCQQNASLLKRSVLATEANFDEQQYLRHNPDVAAAVANGVIESGYAHFQKWGRTENRPLRIEYVNGLRYANQLIPSVDLNPDRFRTSFPELTDPLFWAIYEKSAQYSLLLVPGFYNLYQSIHYILTNKISGDFIECGCLFGGAAIFTHHVLRARNVRRKLYLFDTFEGSPLGEESDLFQGGSTSGHQVTNFLDAVKKNLREEGCELDDFILVPGKVEDTLPRASVGKIALLRLDTDFYSSTRCELEHLYPNLVTGGVLIVDDYGIFKGSRTATDEYLSKLDRIPLLNRIDCGVWAGVKP